MKQKAGQRLIQGGDGSDVGDTDKDKWGKRAVRAFLGRATGRRKAIRLRLALNNHREGE